MVSQNQAYQGEIMPKLFRVLAVAFIALGGIPAAASVANAQTKPLVTTLGPDFPKTEIFIGNSFFYYNNSMHRPSCWLMAADGRPRQQAGLSRHLGHDQRLRLRLA